MPRAKNAVASRARRKKVLKRAKGMWGNRGNVLTTAKHAVDKAAQYQYRDRRQKKRNFRALWITRINAAARLYGTTYSKLIAAMTEKNIEINRKSLAELAVKDIQAFEAVVKAALA
ncbi:MAG: 50S ribosomal protein L20 [[Candidatus Thermochlorobacteriaceae] bacterium GBChlB]|nr:MAG: 50S ribosomal protein L20 [[Candidatus Thermochlorobacteriaceae] bacterium GBChlB]